MTRDRRRRKRDATLAEACRKIAAHIDASCPDLALENVGVHVWIIGGPSSELRLIRGEQFLLRERQPSAITWTKGKGVIGKCWEEEAPLIVDLESYLYDRATDEAAFEAIPPQDRFHLEWSELVRTARYKTIWAAPLFDRAAHPRLRGVVSIDVQSSGQFDALLAATSGNNELNAILGVCEGALMS